MPKRLKFSLIAARMWIPKIKKVKLLWIKLPGGVISKESYRKYKQNTEALSFLCSGRNEMVKILIDRGANVDSKDNFGGTPLHQAASAGNSNGIVSEIQAKSLSFFISLIR